MAMEFSKGFAANLNAADQGPVRETITVLASAATLIARLCARGPLEGALGATTGGQNSDGDAQKALDVKCDEIITDALRGAPVAYYASEEQEGIVTLDKTKPLAVASDPLDGSSNIDTNISIGTIFSIYPSARTARASFMRTGSEQLAGGFFVFGPQTSLFITTGAGTQHYILDPDRHVFTPVPLATPIAQGQYEYAINASNYQHWAAPLRAFIEDCQMGKPGPMGAKCNMRWVGSLVADAGRILSRGGVFLYPGDDRAGYEQGRLRILYEASPVAFIIEQAGGAATDGSRRILDIPVTDLHQRVPFVFGSKDLVEMIANYERTS